MKKLMIIMALLIGVYGTSEAGWGILKKINPLKLLGIGGGKGDTTLDISKKNTQISDTEVKAGVNDNTAVIKKLTGVEMKMDKMMEVHMENQLTLTGVNETINGDVTITNDPQLLKYFIGVLGMIIMTLIRGNFAERKHRRKLEKSKDVWKDKMLTMLIKNEINEDKH